MKKVFLYTLTVFLLFSMLAQVSAPAQEVIFPESFTSGLGQLTVAGRVYTGTYGVHISGGAPNTIIDSYTVSTIDYSDIAFSYETYPADNIVLGGTSGVEPPPPPWIEPLSKGPGSYGGHARGQPWPFQLCQHKGFFRIRIWRRHPILPD